jgi:hypothetical protein
MTELSLDLIASKVYCLVWTYMLEPFIGREFVSFKLDFKQYKNIYVAMRFYR